MKGTIELKRTFVFAAMITLLMVSLPSLPSPCSETTSAAATITIPQARRRATLRRRERSTARTTATGMSELLDARARVATQIKNVTRFLYLYGRTSNTIEIAERDRVNTGVPDTPEALDDTRLALVENIRNVRIGFDDLAQRFRTTRSLALYSEIIADAADLAAQAEQDATANRFDQAGRRLIDAAGSTLR